MLLLSRAEADQLAGHLGSTAFSPKNGSIQTADLKSPTISVAVTAVSVNLLGSNDVLLIADKNHAETLLNAMTSAGLSLESPEDFERQRIASFWPLSGREILEKSIPQELDRDPSAISFTKGCYLGQETIARLDAIGQLQKKLCAVQINASAVVEPGAALMKADQQVGQITSAVLAANGNHVLALAYLRRGNFEPGLQLTCNDFSASVLNTRSEN